MADQRREFTNLFHKKMKSQEENQNNLISKDEENIKEKRAQKRQEIYELEKKMKTDYHEKYDSFGQGGGWYFF